MGDDADERRREVTERAAFHAEALRRRKPEESARAQVLIDRFVAQARQMGLPTEELTAGPGPAPVATAPASTAGTCAPTARSASAPTAVSTCSTCRQCPSAGGARSARRAEPAATRRRQGGRRRRRVRPRRPPAASAAPARGLTHRRRSVTRLPTDRAQRGRRTRQPDTAMLEQRQDRRPAAQHDRPDSRPLGRRTTDQQQPAEHRYRPGDRGRGLGDEPRRRSRADPLQRGSHADQPAVGG